jgi:hypothetical protein
MANQRTYHASRRLIAIVEQTMQGLYYTPGTDPKWTVVCQQVTTLRTLITALQKASGA